MLNANLQFNWGNSPKENMLAMLHGMFGMSSNLLGLARNFRNALYPITYDLPNHGHSPTVKNCDFITIADMLDKTLERDKPLHNTKIHLLGHSLGGKVMMVYALLFPKKIESLSILDIAPVEYPHLHGNFFEGMHNLIDEKPKSRREIINFLTQYTDPETAMFLAKNFKPAEPRSGEPFKSLLRIDELYANYTTLMNFPDKELKHCTYTGKTILLRATRESAFYEDNDKKSVYHYFPNCRIVTIPNSGHNVHIDNPEAVEATLKGFWGI